MRLDQVLQWPLYKRQRALAANRPVLTKNDFVGQISTTAIGRAAAELLWEELEALKVVDEFHPDPLDDLLKVYGLADEDLDEDIILAIIRRGWFHCPQS
jgi:hypothetical protein